jgi:hypothetical protein
LPKSRVNAPKDHKDHNTTDSKIVARSLGGEALSQGRRTTSVSILAYLWDLKLMEIHANGIV